MPARLPNTSRSDRELPPSRLEPCIPPDTSPAANRPGTAAAAVSGSTSTPPLLDLRVDGPGHLVAGEQLGRTPVVVRIFVPAVRLLLGLRVLLAEDVGD